ncbi:hypothetical protein LCGC14_2781960 [marine sediment metagenome]|uniref:Sulfotransferase domain-containing protein n=1 Tax=marine sediment metagenome TaxID=412755 RepID=A0A0F9BJL0_9ZZZZ
MSVYNHKLKAVFIHSPRCAGNSMEELVGGQGHKDSIYFKRFLIGQTEGLDYNDIFKFAFVRNPYDRFVSCYQWLKENNPSIKENVNEFATQLAEKYESWKDGSLNEIMFRPQWKYLCNQYKHLQVDFVGRFEDIKDDWNIVSKKLGIKDELPHTNKSKKLKTTLTGRSKSIIKKLYKDDFEVFGYQ